MPTYSQAGKFGPAAISGAPAGAPLRVQTASGSDAVLYADASKNKTVGPIVQANDAGNVTFFADPGTYTVRWTGGSTTVTVSGGSVDSSSVGSDAYLSGNLLASGEETVFRGTVFHTTVTQTSGQVRLTYFTARRTEVTTQVRVITGGTGAAATPTLCKMGLWEIADNGDGTLVAATANDTALFSTISTTYTKSWATPYTKIAGQRYAFGVLVVSGATMPVFTGSLTINTGEIGAAPRMAGLVAGQTDLADFAAGSISATSNLMYAVVMP